MPVAVRTNILKALRIFTLLALPLPLTGAAIIDQPTREGIQEIREKVSELDTELRVRQTAILQAISELKGMKGPSGQVGQVGQIGQVGSLAASLEKQARLLETILTGLTELKTARTITAFGPPPVAATPNAQPDAALGNRLEAKVSNLESLTLLTALLLAITLIGLIGIVVAFRKGEDRVKEAIWKMEIANLRPEVLSRPHLEVKTRDTHLSIVNTGQTPAEEIRLFLGPAPATLRQRKRSIGLIGAGEQTEVDLSAQGPAEVLYGTVEYRNPYTGKTYKDQFVLRTDPESGRMVTESPAA